MFRKLIAALILFVLPACGDTMTSPDEPVPEAFADVTIIAVVPEGTGDVYLATNRNGWSPDASPMTPEGGAPNRRVAQLLLTEGFDLEYKFTLGSWAREAVDGAGLPLENAILTASDGLSVTHEIEGFKADPETLLDTWQDAGILGTLIYWRDVESEFLDRTRNVSVWLPPGYAEAENEGVRYPVIYMTDGQNLFDPRIANTGTDWGIDEAMMRGMESGAFPPAIVVAHWSTDMRGQEYSPWHDASKLAQFVKDELKPRVDQEFRTLTDRDNTFAMGSSMGGLYAMYLVMEHAETFSACGCVSSHLPFSEAVIAQFQGQDPSEADETPYYLRDIEAGGLLIPDGARMFFDWGTATLDALYPPEHGKLREHFEAQGYAFGEDYYLREYPGAEHNEAAWRTRVQDQLHWMLAREIPPGE
ncbi:esterase family protein [Parvularcula sp. ZS-1/3]|uniref:Esterase family protein n=1 Tax=Parvularcula mediterranea TaxID=2732508 RepID=A0A7Y3RJK5_9PROT|nr:alpha/beta hydrolase-fold protein [Parvularcula mediterranea]NNU15284.1 esterase family protein [Parvularcula mediterranea]